MVPRPKPASRQECAVRRLVGRSSRKGMMCCDAVTLGWWKSAAARWGRFIRRVRMGSIRVR